MTDTDSCAGVKGFQSGGQRLSRRVKRDLAVTALPSFARIDPDRQRLQEIRVLRFFTRLGAHGVAAHSLISTPM